MEHYWNLCYLLFLTDNMSVFECLSWYSKHGQWATVEFVHFSKWIPKFYFVVFYSVTLPYWKHTKPWPQIQKTYRTLNFVNITPLLSIVLHHYDWWFTLFIHLNLCFSHVQRPYSELCHHFYFSVTHFYYEWHVLLNGTPPAVISLPFKGNIHIKSQPITLFPHFIL